MEVRRHSGIVVTVSTALWRSILVALVLASSKSLNMHKAEAQRGRVSSWEVQKARFGTWPSRARSVPVGPKQLQLAPSLKL